MNGAVVLAGTDTCIGYDELCWLAVGRSWTRDERRLIGAMEQDERNDWVRAHAALAGDVVRVEDRHGTDGIVYAAFWLEHPAWFEKLEMSDPVRLGHVRLAGVPAKAGCWIVTPDGEPPIPRKARAVHPVANLRREAPRCSERTSYGRWIAARDAESLAINLGAYLRPSE